jgi:hypothetical protein
VTCHLRPANQDIVERRQPIEKAVVAVVVHLNRVYGEQCIILMSTQRASACTYQLAIIHHVCVLTCLADESRRPVQNSGPTCV